MAFSLLEVIAVIVILGIVTALVIANSHQCAASAKAAVCHTNIGDIELQAELWLQQTGSWPADSLSDVGADLNYFPSGLPTCPVDGSAYELDGAGNVVGHAH